MYVGGRTVNCERKEEQEFGMGIGIGKEVNM